MKAKQILKVIAPIIKAGEDQLTVRELAVMLFLERGEQDFSVVARELQLVKPAVTRITDRLGVRGYATRRRGAESSRKVFISLTDRGHAFVKQLEAA